MKRFVSTLAVVAVTLTPLTAMASTLTAGEQYSLSADRVVVGNLYVAAGTATVGGRVTGDVFAGGGTIAISGSVGGDVAAAGGTVQVLGPVDGDVRVIGGTISVNERVGGDVVVAGGTLHILPSSTVAGDVYVAGGQVIIDGVVSGSVKTAGGALVINGTVRGAVNAKIDERLMIGPEAYVGGKLTYSAPAEIVVPDGATLAGGTDYTARKATGFDRGATQRTMWALLSVMTGLQMLTVLGLAALLVWRWRRMTLEVISGVRDTFWPSIGRGLAYLILVPIASVLLLMSVIGTLPGVLVLLGYAAVCILAKALAGMLFGSFVVMVVKKNQVMHLTWGSALGGVIALKLVGLIPVIGWMISAAAWLAVFGALAHRVQEGVTKS